MRSGEWEHVLVVWEEQWEVQGQAAFLIHLHSEWSGQPQVVEYYY